MEASRNGITNETMLAHAFVAPMRADSFYPPRLVQQIENTLLDLCREIETSKPASLTELYQVTRHATERINEMTSLFSALGSDFETVAAETIALDFQFIAQSYGYHDADIEQLVGYRTW